MLLFTEGFDWTTTIGNLSTYNKWLDQLNGNIGNSSVNLRFGTGSGNYWNTNGANNFIRRPFGSNLASGVLGVALMCATSVNYKGNIFVLFDTTANVQMGLQLNTDGTFSVYRTSNANILGTSTFAITGNQWCYIELKWKISDSISSGDVEVYVDGTNILSIAAGSDTKNTANAYATHYALGGDTPTVGSGSTTNKYWDDHYCIDLTGTTNNAPLGSVRVQTLFPNGNGTHSDFTGSDGNSVNNYQQVDETALNVADYNDGTAVNQIDTYAFTDTVSTTSVVKGAQVNWIANKTDASSRSVAPVVRHSSSDYVGSNQALATNNLWYAQVYETNPGTSSGWTKSDLDAAEFGLKVTV